MKARKLLSLLAIAVLVLGLAACKKDKSSGSSSSPTTPPPADYGFSVGGTKANYVDAEKPEPTAYYIPNVNMNNQALAGGANYITVSSEVRASKIIVANPSKAGYIEVTPHQAAATDREIIYDFFMVVNQQQEGNSLNVVFAIVDENGDVSGYYAAMIEILNNGTGVLQVSLTFDTPKDVDLHLIEPNGYHIYYADRESNNGGELDVDSNAGCSIDNINNENIFYSEYAYVEPGTYTVYVDMFENCNEDYPTNFILTVFYEGQVLVNPIAGHFPANEPSNYNNLEAISPVCTFRIPNPGHQPPAKLEKKALPKFLRSLDKMQ